jgi:hypothetical protein
MGQNQLLDSALPPLAEAQVAAPLNYNPTLLGQMLEMVTIDNILDYYFTYCRWIFCHVWEPLFCAQWEEYQSGHSSNELVLATCCGILALSLYAPAPPCYALILSRSRALANTNHRAVKLRRRLDGCDDPSVSR